MTVPGRGNDLDALPELLQLVLDKLVATFETARVDLPARRYIAFGGVVADCEQLTSQLIQVYPGLPGADPNQVQKCDGPLTAVIVSQLFRKQPASSQRGTPPTASEISAATRVVARDVWLMLEAAHAVDAAGWNTGLIAEVSPIEPQGGLGGCAMTLTLQVP